MIKHLSVFCALFVFSTTTNDVYASQFEEIIVNDNKELLVDSLVRQTQAQLSFSVIQPAIDIFPSTSTTVLVSTLEFGAQLLRNKTFTHLSGCLSEDENEALNDVLLYSFTGSTIRGVGYMAEILGYHSLSLGLDCIGTGLLAMEAIKASTLKRLIKNN